MSRALVLVLALAGCMPGGSIGAGVSGGVGGGGGGGGAGPVSSGDDLVVPDLTGKTLEEAQALVHQAGFTQEVETSRPVYCEDAAQTPGKINCQDPDPGKTVKRYTMIAVNVYQPTVFVGSIVRGQILPLVGLSIDQAKAGLAKLGFKGTVEIYPAHHYIESCKLDTVCGIEPEAGFPLDATISFTVNKKIEISAPPP